MRYHDIKKAELEDVEAPTDFCPLLKTDCVGVRCAFYYNRACALYRIANSLEMIEDSQKY
jgi:hypothetical protein